MHYNLLDEKWFPVLWKDGKSSRVGILEALTEAHRIRQIAASNPMDRLATLRFLLALLYWCRGNPTDDNNSASSFPLDWFKKLDENRDYFNVLGEGKRFYQCKAKGKKLSANYLIHEVPTGTNSWHFRHSVDMRDGLCRACCAAGLLRLPLFATSGGRGKPPGINQKPPVYAIPVGDSLLHTLGLSWRTVSASDLGTPAWEQPDLPLPQKGEVPLLAGLTWIPRRVWLDNPVKFEAVCISCGRTDFLIRECVFAGIGSTQSITTTNLEAFPSNKVIPQKLIKRLRYDKAEKHLVLKGNLTTRDMDDLLKLSQEIPYQQAVNELYAGQLLREWNDPHVIREAAPGDALKAPDASAKQWAKVIAEALKERTTLTRTLIVAFATVENDKYLEATENTTPELLLSQPEQITKWAEDKLETKLRKIIRGTRKSRKGDARVAISAIASIRPSVEARVSKKEIELIAGGASAWQDAAREYAPMMAAVAKSLSPGYTTAALWRRRQIADTGPDMNPKKAAQKKGRDK